MASFHHQHPWLYHPEPPPDLSTTGSTITAASLLPSTAASNFAPGNKTRRRGATLTGEMTRRRGAALAGERKLRQGEATAPGSRLASIKLGRGALPCIMAQTAAELLSWDGERHIVELGRAAAMLLDWAVQPGISSSISQAGQQLL
ncbi:hypothetical protein Drorol1_Dr00014007 [Drosera rotundifolia]